MDFNSCARGGEEVVQDSSSNGQVFMKLGKRAGPTYSFGDY